MIRGIHHVAVHVRDLDRMIRFYQQAFGFEQVDAFEWAPMPFMDQILGVPGTAARGAMLRAGTCHLEMFQFSEPAPTVTQPLKPYDRGYTHFCVDVTDIEKEYTRLKGLGMTFGHPEPLDADHVKTIYGRDPEGNIIEIQQTAPHCKFRLDQLPPLRYSGS
jgi:catechol 2,3-dioxygenase-like lactoylglutathione lyase family enzyme